MMEPVALWHLWLQITELLARTTARVPQRRRFAL
jgi:hypothetical protein